MRKILPVMIAKGHSSRLRDKNVKEFNGMPLFKWNLLKLKSIFDEVVIDSDDQYILQTGSEVGAIAHERNKNVVGNDVPSIKIFKSILEDFKDYDGIINIQANSPNVKKQLIHKAYKIISNEYSDHILTMNEDLTWNGSVWCITKEIIFNTKDFYNIQPDMYLLDDSIDIHTQEEFDEALIRES
ncbi:hypothetical protein OA953_02075 [Gammaproteobacteria bacterium]|jgi:CMP-N-acetylneuraminic acid synthetase|nr:hypothetical protein [Gammaproteobacteria bacterium]